MSDHHIAPLLNLAIDGRDAQARKRLFGIIYAMAVEKVYRDSKVQLRFRLARHSLPHRPSQDQMLQLIEGEEFAIRVLSSVLESLFEERALVALLTKARLRARARGCAAGCAELGWALSFPVTHARDRMDRQTSGRKTLERNLRVARNDGLLDELVMVTIQDRPGWRASLDEAVREGLIGAPLAIRHHPRMKSWLLFCTEARRNGGARFGAQRCSRVLGPPGMAAGVCGCRDPLAAWRGLDRASYTDCAALAREIPRIEPGPPTRPGTRPSLPKAEVLRFFVALLGALERPVLRTVFLAALYRYALPDRQEHWLTGRCLRHMGHDGARRGLHTDVSERELAAGVPLAHQR